MPAGELKMTMPTNQNTGAPAPGGAAGGSVVLSAKGLTKEFKGFVAVKDVDLSVREGSIHALIGPNGAGKTTCFNLLTKFLQPTRGVITYRGQDITGLAPAEISRLGVVRSFQISAVFPSLSVLENVRIALQRPGQLATQFWKPETALSVLNDRAAALIRSVGLDAFINHTAGELPYGRKRALELAATLALEPDVMLLDEPMAGMAHEDIGHIADLIRQAAQGRTVIMVEHNLHVVEDLCDAVTVLQRGEILAEGDYQTVSQDPRVREAYMGSEHD